MFLVSILNEFMNLFLEMAPYLLLGLFFAGVLHLFITKKMVAKHIGRNNFLSVFKSVILGIPMPLCSCGVIPTAVFFSKNGASVASVIAFLIATPQTGVDSILATFGMMGWVFAIFRPLAALIMGISGGLLMLIFTKKERNIPASASNETTADLEEKPESQTVKQKLHSAYEYAFVRTLDDISIQFLTGLLIAALISLLLPGDFVSDLPISKGILGMFFILLAGIPLYICATASIPIAVTLLAKGFSPGIAFVFLTTGPVTNIVSIIILSKLLGKKATAIYIGIIASFSILLGQVLDQIFIYWNLSPEKWIANVHNHNEAIAWMKYVFGTIFLVLLIQSLKRKLRGKKACA